jgi:hypothetical protein
MKGETKGLTGFQKLGRLTVLFQSAEATGASAKSVEQVWGTVICRIKAIHRPIMELPEKL